MNIPGNLKYAKTHEWVRVEDKLAYMGITDYAQESLGDIVYVEIPELDAGIKKGEETATIESVKAVSVIYAPASGTIAKVNENLDESPELINQKPYEAFIFAIEMSDPTELEDLMDSLAYEEFLKQEEEKH